MVFTQNEPLQPNLEIHLRIAASPFRLHVEDSENFNVFPYFFFELKKI